MSRKRPGHDIALDELNEIFVGLFKRIVKRGNPTPNVMHRVSKNLSLLKDNHEDMRNANDIKSGKGKRKIATFQVDFERVIAYFKATNILANQDRKITQTFGVKVPKEAAKSKKLERRYSKSGQRSVEERALEEYVSKYLPKFMAKLQEEGGAEMFDDSSEGDDHDDDDDDDEGENPFDDEDDN